MAKAHEEELPDWQQCIEDFAEYLRHEGYPVDLAEEASQWIDDYCMTDSEQRQQAIEYYGEFLGEDEDYEALKFLMSHTTYEQRKHKRIVHWNECELQEALHILEGVKLEEPSRHNILCDAVEMLMQITKDV